MIIILYYTLIKNKKFIKERSKRGERTMMEEEHIEILLKRNQEKFDGEASRQRTQCNDRKSKNEGKDGTKRKRSLSKQDREREEETVI